MDKCEIYASPKECVYCEKGSYLKGGTCMAVQATNCESIKSQNECLSCIAGHGLKREGDFVNCVKVEKKNC